MSTDFNSEYSVDLSSSQNSDSYDSYDSQDDAAPSTPTVRSSIQRTLVILKHHALKHRFDIESRIQEEGFEIVKERQMEFDTETDPDTLYELFGDDTPSLAEGPVWVYVLERRNAIQNWLSIMGEADPELARQSNPSSIRALYGTSTSQNVIMASPDESLAEIQILSLFASSPPFHSTDLPDTASIRFDSLRSVSSSVLSALRKGSDDEGYARSDPSTVGNGSKGSYGSGGRTPRLGANGKPLFRARPIPNSHLTPSIQPRTTRAAALRAGVPLPPTNTSPRAPPSADRLAQTFANVPGHKRSEPIPVASTAPPVVAPRMTRAASLRLGQKVPETPRRRVTTDPDKNTFEGVPGHKRRESISVASTAAPTVAPRTNKSAHLRTLGGPPPSSFMFKQPVEPKLPGRSHSQAGMNSDGLNVARPASAQSNSRSNSVSHPSSTASRRQSTIGYSSYSRARPSTANASMTPPRTMSKAASVSPTSSATLESPPAEATATAGMKPRVSSVMAPTIQPRTNRSALLRAAKLEAEEAAAAAKAAKMKGRAKVVPSARAVFA